MRENEEELSNSSILIVKSLEPAAKWVWSLVMASEVTGAVNLINKPCGVPCMVG